MFCEILFIWNEKNKQDLIVKNKIYITKAEIIADFWWTNK